MYNELPVTSGGIGIGLLGAVFPFWGVMGVVLILTAAIICYKFGKLLLGEKTS